MRQVLGYGPQSSASRRPTGLSWYETYHLNSMEMRILRPRSSPGLLRFRQRRLATGGAGELQRRIRRYRLFKLMAVVPLLAACQHAADDPQASLSPSSRGIESRAAQSHPGLTSTSFPESPGLKPEMQAEWSRAEIAAHSAGIQLKITSGYRSAEQQRKLWNEAVKRYGSVKLAARWVLPPNKSEHVQGIAVDVDRKTALWLSKNGARYHLCQSYQNEWWHYAYRSDVVSKCPKPGLTPLVASNPSLAVGHSVSI